jgi:hypothetical protein
MNQCNTSGDAVSNTGRWRAAERRDMAVHAALAMLFACSQYCQSLPLFRVGHLTYVAAAVIVGFVGAQAVLVQPQ